IARAVILDSVRGGSREPDHSRAASYVRSLRDSVVRAARTDPAYAALLLYIPTVGELILDMKDADPTAIHVVRLELRRAVARALEDELLAALEKTEPTTFDPS